MSPELIGIIVIGIAAIGVIGLLFYAKRDVEEQLRRNLALQSQFQKWNAEKLDSLSQRMDQVLEMIRKGEI